MAFRAQRQEITLGECAERKGRGPRAVIRAKNWKKSLQRELGRSIPKIPRELRKGGVEQAGSSACQQQGEGHCH